MHVFEHVCNNIYICIFFCAARRVHVCRPPARYRALEKRPERLSVTLRAQSPACPQRAWRPGLEQSNWQVSACDSEAWGPSAARSPRRWGLPHQFSNSKATAATHVRSLCDKAIATTHVRPPCDSAYYNTQRYHYRASCLLGFNVETKTCMLPSALTGYFGAHWSSNSSTLSQTSSLQPFPWIIGLSGALLPLMFAVQLEKSQGLFPRYRGLHGRLTSTQGCAPKLTYHICTGIGPPQASHLWFLLRGSFPPRFPSASVE